MRGASGPECSRERNRDSVAYLLIHIRYANISEAEAVGKALQASSFPYRDRPVLNRMDVRTPMRVTFGEDGRGEACPVKAAIALCVIGKFSPLHPCRQQLSGYLTPISSRLHVANPFEVLLAKSRTYVVCQPGGTVTHLILEFRHRLEVVGLPLDQAAVRNGRKVSEGLLDGNILLLMRGLWDQ